MRGAIAVVALWVGLLMTTPAQAWSAFGHRLVALLAQDQLSPQTRSQVDALLALEPGADLGTIAAWADEIRDRPEYRFTATFHYVNFRDGSCHYDAARDCANGGCIVDALERYTRVLGDAGRTPSERLEALKFVVHFTGDIHQPMHAGNRDDRGGNRFQVRVGDEGSNLHSVWDYHLLQSAGLNMAAYRERLAPQVTTTDIVPMEFTTWAESSCRLLDNAGTYPARPGKLPSGYLDEFRPLAESRVVLASARLVAVLERTLAPASAAVVEAER
ncbi:S1/P1 nuclease [Xanthomonadaceae bacterium JHOS43]|nr:S1/P1 nuclease [Xanthomonadaceae bacterium JHOS43]MCX7562124.1 S1/P1 nuclease [Xanthomonadaceae bacterium XH05]